MEFPWCLLAKPFDQCGTALTVATFAASMLTGASAGVE